MQHPKLEVIKRTILGKQVKKMRREGILPANIYGKALDSTSVQVKFSEFEAVYKKVGETGLVDVMLDEKRHPVLIKNVQWNYRTRTPLHVDFYQVNLTEKVKAMIPVVITGVPTAVADKLGVLLTPLSEIEVEALPEQLPENIEVDVTHLANLNEQITVADLKVAEGVTVLTEPEQVIARIGEMMKEEVIEAPTTETTLPEVIGEAEKAAAEGVAAAEGSGGPKEEKEKKDSAKQN
jgi:large subunit ribosomal protein L25